MSIKGRFLKQSSSIILSLKIKNKSSIPVSSLTFQLAPNYFGLKPGKLGFQNIAPGELSELSIPIDFSGKRNISAFPSHPYKLDLAFKCEVDTFFFKIPIHLHLLLVNPHFIERTQEASSYQATSRKIGLEFMRIRKLILK